MTMLSIGPLARNRHIDVRSFRPVCIVYCGNLLIAGHGIPVYRNVISYTRLKNVLLVVTPGTRPLYLVLVYPVSLHL